jgi:hypothetical protein
MSPEEFEVKDGISRRRMLKRIGAGAAIAWSAPVLSSIRTPAFAQRENVCASACGGGCTPGVPCDVAHACDAACALTCVCFNKFDLSECRCRAFPSNSCADYPPCSSDADCAAGSVCQATCCPTGICMTACAGAQGRAPRMDVRGAKLTR